MICPLCNSVNSVLLQEGIKKSPRGKIFKCGSCTFVYQGPVRNIKRLNNFYRTKYQYKPDFKPDETENGLGPNFFNIKRYLRVKDHIPKEMKVLEIGCGNGGFLKLIKPHVKEVVGVELTQGYVDALRGEEGLRIYNVPIEDLNIQEKFDVICVFATLEHVPNIIQFMNHLKRYMHEKTRVYLDVPNLMDPLISLYNIEEFRKFYFRKTHLYYFTPETLTLLLKKTGFEGKIELIQYYSLTNHLHWIYKKQPQPDSNTALSTNLPISLDSEYRKILEDVNEKYKKFLVSHNYSDVIWCEAKLES